MTDKQEARKAEGLTGTEKKPYRVADGVEWINGAKVPADSIVRLNDAEALYDKSLGRIAAVEGKPRSRKGKGGAEAPAEETAAADAGANQVAGEPAEE
ncbi:MAG: hypothetical protein KDJ90_06855 [Nitratireductor sp.]|nr:hypothetical protein [Nitratireductor sp.]